MALAGSVVVVDSVVAVLLAAVNVFGGFLVTRRMLEMFKKKAPKQITHASKGGAQ